MIELQRVGRALVALSGASLRLSGGMTSAVSLEDWAGVHPSVWDHAGVEPDTGKRALVALWALALARCKLAGLEIVADIIVGRSFGPREESPEAVTWAPDLASLCIECAALADLVLAGMLPAQEATDLVLATPFGESVFRDE